MLMCRIWLWIKKNVIVLKYHSPEQLGFAFLLYGPQLGIDVHVADMDSLFSMKALAVRMMTNAIINYSKKTATAYDPNTDKPMSVLT